MGKTSGLYLEDSLSVFATEQAKLHHGKVMNRYISELVERDRDRVQKGEADKGNELLALARIHHPSFAEKLELSFKNLQAARPEAFSPGYQRRILARMFEALATALDNPGFNPEDSFTFSSTRLDLSDVLDKDPKFLDKLVSALASRPDQASLEASFAEANERAKAQVESENASVGAKRPRRSPSKAEVPHP